MYHWRILKTVYSLAEDQLPDLCTEFESLTCTVGSNSELKNIKFYF